MQRTGLLLASCLLLVAGLGPASSQTQQDADQIKAAILSFETALSSRDLGAVERLWAHEPYAAVFSPRDQSLSYGWEAVKRHWEEVFAFWSFLKVSLIEQPRIHVSGNVAWASTVADAQGQVTHGGPLGFRTAQTDILEKRGDRWLMVYHHASRIPE